MQNENESAGYWITKYGVAIWCCTYGDVRLQASEPHELSTMGPWLPKPEHSPHPTALAKSSSSFSSFSFLFPFYFIS